MSSRDKWTQAAGGFLWFSLTQPQGKWASTPPAPQGIKGWVGSSWLLAQCGQSARLVFYEGC